MHPSKGKWKGYGRGKNATPGNQPVGSPAGGRPLFNETLLNEIREEHLRQPENIAREFCRTKKDPPSAKPVLARWRTPQPHGKTVSDAKGREHASAGVRHKSCIVMLQGIASHKDSHQQCRSHPQTPKRRLEDITSARR